MNNYINIADTIELINKKHTTLQQLCVFLFKDIVKFQNKRESFYLKQFKNDCINGYIDINKSKSQVFADEMYAKIQNDTKEFASKYALSSIDLVLDAANQNQFKNKLGCKNLLVLLTSLKDLDVSNF